MKLIAYLIPILLLAPNCLFAGKPNPAENEYIKMEGADIWTQPDAEGKMLLVSSFLFYLKKPLTLTRVRVEDVTTNNAVLLVDDTNPKTKKSKDRTFWTGKAPATG